MVHAEPPTPDSLVRALDDATAAARLTDALSRSSVDSVRALDRLSRSSSFAHLAFAASDVARAAALGASSTGALAMLAMVRDGRVREAAVAALASTPGALATTVLLLRVDDVVAPIAERAAHALEARLLAERVSELVPSVALLDGRDAKLRRTTVGDRVRALARDVLLSDDPRCRDALERAMTAPDAAVRAASARFVIAAGSQEEATLRALSTALDDALPRTRAWAANVVAAAATAPSIVRALVPRLAADTSPSVRARAVRAAKRTGQADTLRALCLDVNAGIRSDARRAIGRAGGDDERDRAREQLLAAGASTDDVRAALLALAEIGRAEDFAVVAPFLHDTRRSVAAAAVRALVGVHASGGLDAFVDVLHDKLKGSDRVACEAARGLSLIDKKLVDVDAVRARGGRGSRRLRLALAPLI